MSRAVMKLAKSVLRPWIRRRAQQQLESVRRIGLPSASKVAAAIDAALTNQLAPEERRWVERIEALRAELFRNTTPLSAVELGAADATSARTLEQINPDAKPCTIAEACRASKTYFWSVLLFKLVRELQSNTAVELGTCLGISAAYQAAAQQLNGHGKFITLEGYASRAAQSRRNLSSLGLAGAAVVAGIFDDTLDNTLRENSPVDYAFIDGHHDEHATLKYYQQFLPHLVGESVVVFDDIAWSPGMCRVWEKLQQHPNVAVSIDMLNVGLCIVTKSAAASKHRLKIRMPT